MPLWKCIRGVHTFSHGPPECCFNHHTQAELTSLTFAANDIKQRVVLPTAFCRRKLIPNLSNKNLDFIDPKHMKMVSTKVLKLRLIYFQ